MSNTLTGSNQPLHSWKKRLHEIEESCPWPGPRPLVVELDSTKAWRMAGRLEEMQAFIATLRQHDFLVFHGVSGVGKSSLLQIGLRPAMEVTGFEPIICYRWNVGEDSDIDIESYMQSVIRANLHGDPRLPRYEALLQQGLSVGESLLEIGSSKTVLILDQFEEYIRSHEQGFTAMANWLESLNKEQRGLRIVLSMRSEYTYVLEDNIFSQNRLRAFSFDSVRLSAIEDDTSIAEIIDPSSNEEFAHAYSNYHPIEEAACEALLSEWAKTGPGISQRTLLGLQAVLYALYWIAYEAASEAEGNASPQIKLEHIEALRAQSKDAANDDLFLAGFFHTITVKFEHCEQAAEYATREGQFDSKIATPMARLHLYRAIPLMTLGGYKVTQDLKKLCENLFKDERELMWMLPSGFEAFVFERLQNAALNLTHPHAQNGLSDDLLSMSRHEIIEMFYRQHQGAATSAPQLPETTEEQLIVAGGHLDALPWANDANDITSGAMMGLPPEEVLVELLRIFWFSIMWLDESKICRVLKGKDSSITIVHDKLGEALIKWSENWEDEPAIQIASIVETLGVNLDWSGSEWQEFGTGSASRKTEFLINLRWRSCNISEITFKHVEFINCDFRSTRFDRCVFEGVHFINCLLDGAMFDKCEVRGIAEWDSANMHGLDEDVIMRDSLPAFSIRVDKQDIEPLEYYRGKDSRADADKIMLGQKRGSKNPAERESKSGHKSDNDYWLYSAASGVAARSASGKVTGIACEVPPPKGGLTLLGGRISTLMFRACTFAGSEKDEAACGGSLALVFVAGSSLEFVEQEELSIKIAWSALRGLTITQSIEKSPHTTQKSFVVTAEESMLGNLWFGRGLQGSATFSRCTVYALTSLSSPSKTADPAKEAAAGFEVSIADDCNRGFIYNGSGFVEEAKEDSGDDSELAPDAKFNTSTQNRLERLASKADYRTTAARKELLDRVARKSSQTA